MARTQGSALALVAAAAVAVAACFAPLAANAQDIPSYATPPVTVGTDETIHGRIRSVDGAFSITVADDRGFVDAVALHPGTIINPTGLTLAPGMSVTILGYNAGSIFSANEIDTPYDYTGPLPEPVYYGSGYWYPGFAYGYGPAFGLAIVFGGGFGGPWHYEHCGFYGRPWNGHAYFGNYVGVAPLAHGYGGAAPVSGSLRHTNPAAGAVPPSHTPAHAPPAFAGRTFAGETRTYGERSGYSAAQPERAFSSASTSRDEPLERGGDFETAPRGEGAGTVTRGGGSPAVRAGRASGGSRAAAAHGGGHAH